MSLRKSRRMPVERPSAFSGNKRPHNQLGLVPAKKLRPEGGELVVVFIFCKENFS